MFTQLMTLTLLHGIWYVDILSMEQEVPVLIGSHMPGWLFSSAAFPYRLCFMTVLLHCPRCDNSDLITSNGKQEKGNRQINENVVDDGRLSFVCLWEFSR